MTPVECAPKSSDIKESYQLDRAEDINRIQALMEPRGFVVTLNPDGNQIISVDWPSRLSDFAALDQVSEYLANVFNRENGISSIDFDVQTMIDKIRLILLGGRGKNHDYPGSPLFRRLNDSSIETNEAHKVDPFEHTINVLNYLDASLTHLTSIEKYWLVMSAVVHDIGKICIARDDRFQDHARISSLIVKEWVNSEERLPDAIGIEGSNNRILPLVRFHHLPELVDKGEMTPEEMAELMQFSENLQLLGIFAFADATSIGGKYMEYGVENLLGSIDALIGAEKLFNALEFIQNSADILTRFYRGFVGLVPLDQLFHAYLLAKSRLDQFATNLEQLFSGEVPKEIKEISDNVRRYNLLQETQST